MLKSNYQVIMVSHASKGHYPIAMASYNCSYLTLYYDVINNFLLNYGVAYQFVFSSVVSKHLLLALSVLCLLWNSQW